MKKHERMSPMQKKYYQPEAETMPVNEIKKLDLNYYVD